MAQSKTTKTTTKHNTKHTTFLRATKRAAATKARERKQAIPRMHRAGNTRFIKFSMKGRQKCARLNIKLANERSVVSAKPWGGKEAVDLQGGYWSAWLDTLFNEQKSPTA